jgi:REP element-mobilizing transposase RayT
MPRTAREKSTEGLFHVSSRSITEFDFFREDADKIRFLDIFKECTEICKCKVYAYCLMTTHYHIFLDANGFDISDFMKKLNQTYVKYVNKKYGRRGSLVDGRFWSKIINSSEYALTLSAYIHNNPKDIESYTNRVFEYPYSSMAIYLEEQKDTRKLVDTDFILGTVNENDRARARAAYAEMVAEKRDIGTNTELRKYLEEFEKEQFEYKTYRTVLLRNKKPDEIIKAIAEKLGVQDTREIMHRWKRSTMRFREAVAYALTILCGMGTKEACGYMKNISGTCLARLKNKGFEQFRDQAELGYLMGA